VAFGGKWVYARFSQNSNERSFSNTYTLAVGAKKVIA